MEAAPPVPQPQTTHSHSASRPYRYRRPRQGGDQNEGAAEDASQAPSSSSRSGAHRRHPRNAVVSLRPATVAPTSQPLSANPSSAENSGTEAVNRRGASKRGRGSHQPLRTVNGREFGGQLTHEEGPSLALAPTSALAGLSNQLQANAAEFVPGQSHVQSQRYKQTPRQLRPQKQRASKSSAADIATRTHEDIDNGHYECPICTNEVQRSSKVWSCHMCWTVFHLSCIKKWSTNEGSAAAHQNLQDGEAPPLRQWRCPGCNLPQEKLPKVYTCWCEKEIEPRSLPGLPPHSCGQSCGRERLRKCPHSKCSDICHAGVCTPCTQMGPIQVCFCGKHETTKRCVDTDYNAGWSCGEICGEIMPCGEHVCNLPCHQGLCGGCEEPVDAKCYCGQVEKQILCGDRGDDRESSRMYAREDGDVIENWIGMFECGNKCNRPFDCGVHRCSMLCHAQQCGAEHCTRSPDIVTHCPCGKTELENITDKPRKTCSDPIPNCDKSCGKTLPCGHLCRMVCHLGNCLPCLETVEIKCRCGRTTSKTICHQGTEEPPQCMRVCRATLNCGRHVHDERCCESERKAIERQSSKRKQRPLHAAPRQMEDDIEPEHICTRMCGRLLKCGNHECENLCHRRACESCREAVFNEISCHCGKTVLEPPLPCGTQPPPCRYPCGRPKSCGHPQIPHNCHQDDESCPKCPFLVNTLCMCGKKTLKNQQCWLHDVRCGETCGMKLKCGSHFCRNGCHKAGACEDDGGQACQQACGKPKKVCGHADSDQCHAPYPCREEKPCSSTIWVTCDCQAQKQEMRCSASKTSEGNTKKSLPCNDECARLERNRKLAVALNIDQSTHVDGADHVPYSSETLSFFAENFKWAQAQEREFRVFATSDEEKRLRFKPMAAHQRAFLHALAEDFGLDAESMDPEPHRHILLLKTPRFVSAPNKTLAEALRIRQAQRTTAGGLSDSESSKKHHASNEASKPYNSLVISNPRFGLTVDDVRSELAAVVQPAVPMAFDVEFLPSDEVVLKAQSRTLTEQDVQQRLQALQPALAAALSAKAIGSVQLCHTDASLNIVRRESDGSAGDGWSRVAAKGAAPRRLVPPAGLGGNNAFSALSGNKVTFPKKKPENPEKPARPRHVSIVDDWETAEIAEEEKEKASSSGDEAVHPMMGDGSAEPSHGTVSGGQSLDADAPVAAALPAEDMAGPVQTGSDEGEDEARAPASWADDEEAAAH